MKKNENDQPKEVQALSRGLKLLEIVSKEPSGIALSKISRDVKLSKTSTHRLLNTLILNGFVHKDSLRGEYFPSMKLLSLSSELLSNSNFSEITRSYMEPIAKETGETIHLVLFDGNLAVYVEKVESPNTIRMYSSIGNEAPLHCTGVGKAILAFLDKEKIKELLGKGPLQRYTKNTIVDINELLADLEEIKIRGFSIDNSEHEENVCCIATPLFSRTGRVVGAISISAVSYRVDLEKLESWWPFLDHQSKLINSELTFFLDRFI